ncbi:MAG: N-acetylmuramoyl-L-alanine amidase, partial [Muribaculaceae bacterium]|nr:N-acetylmuramoyl-L-alanine amidase [Muribaculaceae bacterium]
MKKIFSIIALFVIAAITMPTEAATKWTNYNIMIDPGHGGSDPGASGPSAPHEATLVLRCGTALKNRIVNECGGTVKMTRTTDTFVSLSSRKASSVSYDPYIFCSLHLNAFNTTAKGTETYYYWTSGNSSLLANKVQAQLIANFKTVSGFTPTNRGVKTANYTVIMGSSNVPAVLTEGLFVDNKTEWNIIKSESNDGFKKWVQGHLYGFYDRLVLLKSDLYDPSGSSSSSTPDPTMTVSPTSMDFSCVEGSSSTNAVSVKGSNLTATPTASISGTGFSISSKSLSATGGSVTVKFSPTASGSYSGTLTITSGSLKKTISLKGTASVAPLTFTEKWNASDQKGTLTKFGWDAGKVRNMTYNKGKLYLVYNHSDIKVVNAQTGADLGNLDKTGIEGGTLTLCDVKACDGKIVACNLATTGEFKVYVWDNDNSAPRVLLSTTNWGGATRIGDYIGFYGTWSSGKLTFGHYASDATRIVSYAITNGTCATTPTVVNATTDGSTILNTGGSTRVYPGSNYYWIDGKNNHTTRLKSDGSREYYIDSEETWGTAFQTFTWKGTEYGVAMTFNTMEGENWNTQTAEQKAKNYTGGRMKLLKKDSEWSKPTDCGDYPSAGLSSTIQNTNCTGNVIAAVNGTSGVEAWVLSTGQGIAYYLHGTASSNTVEEIKPTTPTITASATSASLSAEVGTPTTKSITFTGTKLTGNINLALSGTDADQFKLSTSSLSSTGGSVTITYDPTVGGSHKATLTASSTGASNVTVSLTGTATEKLIVTGATLTQDWAVTSGILAANTESRWASGKDGKIYVNDWKNSKLYYYTKSGKTEVAASAAGTALAHDDAGNIVVGTTIYTNAAVSFKILPAGKTTFQDLAVTLPDGMTTNQMQYLGRIVGDIMSSSGGVMFLFPNTSTSVAKIHIANGVQKSNKKIDIGVLTADAQSIVVPLENNMGSDAIAVRVRANNHFYYHNGTGFVAYANNGINKTQGGTLFTLNETLYAVEPIGTNYVDGFQVVDITNNKILATHTAQFSTQAAAPNANCISAE